MIWKEAEEESSITYFVQPNGEHTTKSEGTFHIPVFLELRDIYIYIHHGFAAFLRLDNSVFLMH